VRVIVCLVGGFLAQRALPFFAASKGEERFHLVGQRVLVPFLRVRSWWCWSPKLVVLVATFVRARTFFGLFGEGAVQVMVTAILSSSQQALLFSAASRWEGGYCFDFFFFFFYFCVE